MIPVFRGKRIGKKIKLYKKEQFNTYLMSLPEDIEVIVRAKRDTRSDQQNRYYWGVVLKIVADETGHTREELHEILKSISMVTKTCIQLNGEVYGVVRSTTSLNTKEMEDYLSECRQWASQKLGCYVPLPNEVEY